MMEKHPGSQLRHPLHRLHQAWCNQPGISPQVDCGDPGCWVIPMVFCCVFGWWFVNGYEVMMIWDGYWYWLVVINFSWLMLIDCYSHMSNSRWLLDILEAGKPQCEMFWLELFPKGRFQDWVLLKWVWIQVYCLEAWLIHSICIVCRFYTFYVWSSHMYTFRFKVILTRFKSLFCAAHSRRQRLD